MPSLLQSLLAAGAVACISASALWADVAITFLPPPHEGTISLGVYNKSGSLVRTLFKEATDKDFTIGLNGFITQWDGRDDSGQPAAPGKYLVRGVSVGEIEVEGVAFHLNDWVLDENPVRIHDISEIHLSPDGDLVLRALLVQNKSETQGKTVLLRLTKDAVLQAVQEPLAITPTNGPLRAREAWVREGAGFREPAGEPLPTLPGLEKPIAAWRCGDGSLWVIETKAGGSELLHFSPSLQLLRSMQFPAAEPQPVQVVGAQSSGSVFLLERTKGLLRVRALEFPAVTSADPQADASGGAKVVLSRTIESSETFAAVAARLGGGKPLAAESRFKVRLLANPLFKDALQEIQVKLGFDREGTVLMDSTGLVLCGLTSTPHLKWASIVADGSKVLRVFQSDGAVVEEFRVRKLANMMSFEAGEYELAAPGKAK